MEYGTCDCDRAECATARAVRAAAADKLCADIRQRYGAAQVFDDVPLVHFPSREWVCRAFPRRSLEACPVCHYVPAFLPPSVVHGAIFALRGTVYRVVSVGSTNRHSPSGLHFEDFATCEAVSSEPWKFPALPAPTVDVSAALHVLFNGLPKFRRFDFNRALFSIGMEAQC